MHNPPLVIEIIGEGKTEIDKPDAQPQSPTKGVLPILVHRLCGSPQAMMVKRRPVPFLQGKGLWQKVRFAKRQAHGSRSAGVVFVVDTEGDQTQRMADLVKGRDSCLLEYAMAVGTAHPCIEAWLLSDAAAIMRALMLEKLPTVHDTPETLPAPKKDRKRNPKTVLAGLVKGQKADLTAKDKTLIAAELKDLILVRRQCPTSFKPFADEVEQRIRPLFASGTPEKS